MRQIVKIASVLSVALWISGCEQKPEQGPQQRGPMEVGVITVAAKPQSIMVELPGRSKAYLEAEVRPQVSGIVLARSFNEGGEVQKGQSLYQIDASQYEAALVSAKAELERAQAAEKSTKATAERFSSLIKSKSISQQDFDTAEANYLEAKASVAVAKAAINTAEINLAYTKVEAPISGRIGKSNVTAGALVGAGQAQALANISQLDPINIDIVQSSTQMLRLKQHIASGQLLHDDTAPVALFLEDGTAYSHKGKLQFAEVTVDENTGAVVLRAEFPNPEGLLLPGMFVRTVLTVGTDPKAILVPQRAITRNTKGQAVAMVIEDGKVAARIVTTAEVIDNQWRITSGLKAGDQLIVEGLQKIRPGAPVKAGPLAADKKPETQQK
ncbi:efflux RND transporter periplasmic adaptor subunit [Shewanella sp. Isolate13]|uniref:efflux RND transporter periplasmic adaptor subunit n=1 Tax=Shewanella sp. Isolate13 TaxID=2908531 RepID=UPI001EFDF6C6|nr:efflux RND transporter periplasmic adaptor subunit [Shewanella sp. Isolate13]MCG9728968.1 efflux RND transporter periplasmic adaptor subunit [Shewanella sp. Isolate13]